MTYMLINHGILAGMILQVVFFWNVGIYHVIYQQYIHSIFGYKTRMIYEV